MTAEIVALIISLCPVECLDFKEFDQAISVKNRYRVLCERTQVDLGCVDDVIVSGITKAQHVACAVENRAWSKPSKKEIEKGAAKTYQEHIKRECIDTK